MSNKAAPTHGQSQNNISSYPISVCWGILLFSILSPIAVFCLIFSSHIHGCSSERELEPRKQKQILFETPTPCSDNRTSSLTAVPE